MMRWLALVLLLLVANAVRAADEAPLVVTVAEPYIELHTGPGRDYPIFHVVSRGKPLTVLYRRTDWYKVDAGRGIQGWAKGEALAKTLQDGQPLPLDRGSREQVVGQGWQGSLWAGDFEGAQLVAVTAGYAFNPLLRVELQGGQAFGDISDSMLADLAVLHQPLPDLWIVPYWGLAAGIITTDPKATAAQSPSRSSESLAAVVGASYYLTRNFALRLEYRNLHVLTDRDDNETVNLWKLGFSASF